MQRVIRHSARLALLWQVAAGLLLAGGVLLIIQLYPQNSFKVPFLWLFLLTVLYSVMIGGMAAQHARQRRFLEPLFRGTLPTTPASMLPDPSLALPPGSSLTLRYQRRSASLVSVVLVYSIRLLITTICFDVALLPFTPDALPTFLGIMNGVPVVAQWLLLLLPPALWVLLSLRALRNSLLVSIQTLTLDDRGITRWRPWGQVEFIAWQEISACVRILLATGDQTLGSYLLYGPDSYLEIPLYPLGVLSGRQSAADYSFSPDPAPYRAAAEQALATILMRANVPLRVVSTAYYNKGGRYSSYAIGVAAQDVARQPEAPAGYQPPPYVLDWARAYPGSYALPATQNLLMIQPVGGARLALGWLVRGLFILLLDIILFFLLLQFSEVSTALLITLLLLLPAAFFLTRGKRHASTRPVEIVAEPMGLSRRGPGPKLLIPWNQVQAWGVLPPGGRQKDAVYAVLWSGTTLTWTEPEQATLPVAPDDGRGSGQVNAAPGQHTLLATRARERSAYLDAAHALHALIIARSGQPMRLLNQ